jgi:excisionase family DNA binding protein
VSQFFSPKEVALAIGVSESSLKRWVDKGLIPAEKTGGGHRRLQLDAVLRFIRDEGKGLANPEIIGLPAETGKIVPAEESAQAEFLQAMSSGNEAPAKRIILDLFISGMSVANICDLVIAPVFQRIGDLWRCGDLEVYQERRACELCGRVIHELRRAVGSGPDDGPLAIGGTLDGDPYTLATNMAEVVLRDAGWRATSLGHMLPFDTLRKAIENDHPHLMWISVTTIRDTERFIANFNVLFDTATSFGCAIIVGGQALTADIRQSLRYTTFCDNLRHMEAFARTIRPRDRVTTPITSPEVKF